MYPSCGFCQLTSYASASQLSSISTPITHYAPFLCAPVFSMKSAPHQLVVLSPAFFRSDATQHIIRPPWTIASTSFSPAFVRHSSVLSIIATSFYSPSSAHRASVTPFDSPGIDNPARSCAFPFIRRVHLVPGVHQPCSIPHSTGVPRMRQAPPPASR